MKHVNIILILIGLLVISGCTSQGKKTHLVFEERNATYNELQSSINNLKQDAHAGSTREQMKIVISLRHIQKYMSDPAKRELAMKGLIFVASFSDDNDVEARADSRIEAVINNSNAEIAYRLAIVSGKRDIVTGKQGYTEDNLVSSNEYVFPDEDEREEALQFLIDYFEDFPPHLQYKTVEAYGVILANDINCLEFDDGVCEENDEEIQKEWKQRIWGAIGKWLESEDITPIIKTSMIALTGKHENIYDEETKETWLNRWSINSDIPGETKKIIIAAQNKSDQIYLVNLDPLSLDDTSDKAPKATIAVKDHKPNKKFVKLGSFTENSFWFNNAEFIIKQQLYREATDTIVFDKIEYKWIPHQWISYVSIVSDELNAGGVDDYEKSTELRSIIYDSIVKALGEGYVISKPANLRRTNLVSTLQEALRSADNEDSPLAIEKTLRLVSKMYPTLKVQKYNVEPLFETLSELSNISSSVYIKRLFYYTMVDGLPYYPISLEDQICNILENSDVLTDHLVRERVVSLPPTILLLSMNNLLVNIESEKTFESETMFCDEPLRIINNEIIIEVPMEEPVLPANDVVDPELEERLNEMINQ